MHAASRHGTPNLTSLPKDDEVSCEVRPPGSPIRSLTSLDRAKVQSPDEDCISHSATQPAGLGHMPGKLQLHIDETVKSTVMPPRRVPPALKSKLKDVLDQLEALWVVTNVTKPADWVYNLVVAEKPNC